MPALTRKTWYYILVMLLITVQVNAQYQTNTLSGFVYDKSNGEGLIGATVNIIGSKLGASTNGSGYFVITNIPNGTFTLRISYLGYRTQKLELASPHQIKQLRIELESENVNLQEVIVKSDKLSLAEKLYERPVSKVTMTGTQVNQIPKVIEADLLRALQTMPGITALSDFSSALNVRGGTPDQNLYMIDGTDVYNPEHAFGIFSTFNTNAIKKVDVSKGGFSSEYGGRLSSVIDVTNLDGNRNNFEGIFNLSLLSGSTTLQIPLGSIGSLSGSFRRTYIDKTYAQWNKDIPPYYFYDGNLKAFLDISDLDKVSLSYFTGDDNLTYKLDSKAEDPFAFFYDWGNTTSSINWKHIFSPKVFANFWVTRSTFDSEFKIDKLFKLDEINKLYDYTIKASLEYYLSNEFALRFGAEHKIMRFQYKEDTKDMLVDIDQKCQLSTTYINTQWRPDNLVDVDFGIRVNYFHGDDNYTNFEPRFQTKYRLTENSSVKFATGLYYQYLNRIPRLFFASIWSAVDKTTKPSSSEHFILSYQRELSDFLELEADVYYKTYKNLYIFNQNLSTDITPGYHTAEGYPVYNSTRDVFVRGDGHSFGFEIMARKEAGAVNGWIAYSYSKTLNTFDGINQGQEYAPRHDRASVVNMVLNGNLGNLFNGKWDEKPEKQSSQWLFGLNFIYASGQPITMPGSAYYINSLPDGYNNVIPSENMPGYKLYPQSINSYRLPAYTRMDLSITYEKNYGSWSLAPYLQIFNIGNRKNLWFIQYKDEAKDGKIVQKIEKMQMLPMLPSIGITVKF